MRPRRRDWLYVGVLALVLTVGLVHFARLSQDAPGLEAGTASATPSSPGTARLESSPTSPPATPGPTSSATPGPAPTSAPTSALTSAPPPVPTESTGSTDSAEPTAGTCWDGRATTAIALCGLPAGARGLTWVFPSFDPDRATCRPARRSDGTPAYAVRTSYVCFERALGQPVTITYDEATDPTEVAAWMAAQAGSARVVAIPGAHGGRLQLLDTDQRPARISGGYAKYPYVVSVFAPTRNAAERAFRTMVLQRPSGLVRGVRGA